MGTEWRFPNRRNDGFLSPDSWCHGRRILHPEDYTNYSVLEEALDTVKVALNLLEWEEYKELEDQETIDNLTELVEGAMVKLEPKSTDSNYDNVNLDELAILIAYALELNPADYTNFNIVYDALGTIDTAFKYIDSDKYKEERTQENIDELSRYLTEELYKLEKKPSATKESHSFGGGDLTEFIDIANQIDSMDPAVYVNTEDIKSSLLSVLDVFVYFSEKDALSQDIIDSAVEYLREEYNRRATKSNDNVDAACNHAFELDLDHANSETEDAEASLRCKYCGAVKESYVVPNSAYYTWNVNTAKKILNASANGTVVIDTNKWTAFHEMVGSALEARPDVTLTVKYTVVGGKENGQRKTFTIPAATESVARQNISERFVDKFCGFGNLADFQTEYQFGK